MQDAEELTGGAADLGGISQPGAGGFTLGPGVGGGTAKWPGKQGVCIGS